MSIKFYNSLSRKKEDFMPLDPDGKVVKMYTCGVTVYDKCHIGHARSLCLFEMMRSYLEYRGFEVVFVRNITDVDDKIIRKAQETGRTSQQVSEANIENYYSDLKLLGIRSADFEPRATQNIDGMISYIKGLIEKGIAYESSGDVYFSVRKFKNYGKLSGQGVDQMREAVRIEKDEKKKDPVDFALWKASKEGEPSWESPWGKGRPGWHIECSVMSLGHLDCETLDIHAGGRDLIFPHHENEIAQAESYTGKPFAKYWIHHGLLTINKQKMAKSLGNFITIEDAVQKYGADALKMFFLSSHYASPIDFSQERVVDAKKALERFNIFFNEAKRSCGVASGADSVKQALVEEYMTKFVAALDDDFNTPKGLGYLYELISEIYKRKGNSDYSAILQAGAKAVTSVLQSVFGLFKEDAEVDIDVAQIDGWIEERKIARQNKDYKKADEIRDVAKGKGIILEDTPQGQVWRKA